MTYSELANYYVPFVSPMVQVALNLAESPSLVNVSPKAKKAADEFYAYTLGTDAVTPEELLDFRTMLVKPQRWSVSSDSWTYGSDKPLPSPNGGDTNPMMTYQGNLSLTYREIENKTKIEKRFAIKFIDMTQPTMAPK
jgi:hypothetical protein